MQTQRPFRLVVITLLALTILRASVPNAFGALADSLVSYWPMDTVVGTKTPDLVGGYDMDLNNLTDGDLVLGKFGKTFAFSNAKKTMLSRVHKAGEALPINQHPAFTVSMWAKVAGTAQNDLRLFSEGNTGNSDPLFNLGTHNVDGTLDVFIRQSGWTTVNHIVTTAQPLDDVWHHIVFAQQTDGSRTIYIDGAADDLVIPAKPAGTFNVNDTTIGGILRASAGFWVTGLIDDVALWKRALTPEEIKTLSTDGLKSVFSPIAIDLVSHWPLDEVVGTKTPDVVSGYDMDLNNLSAADLVTGKIGKTFAFSNAAKTMLSRVHKAGEALPINQHPAFTVSMWAKVNGTGQNDLRLFSEGNTGNSDPLFNLGTHNVDGTLDVFIRQSGWTAVNHIITTAQPLDDAWHYITFVQQTDGSRTIYIDGAADDLVIPAKPAGTFNVNDTTIGGILRASAGFWVTGLIDDVALWKRALEPAEITNVFANGVPAVFTRKAPLEIRTFRADYTAVAQGDSVVLRWEANSDASLAIDNGIGSVSTNTAFGIGSISIPVTASKTFTLTATRGTESVTAQISITAVPGVAPGWRLIENFNGLAAGGIIGKGNWVNPEGTFSVVDLGINRALGYTDGNSLAALPLSSLTLREGQKASLFFRVYVGTNDLASVLAITFGLTERPIRFNGDFNGNVGPYLRLERLGEGLTTDLQAHNGVGAFYEPAPDAIQPGSAYRIWIDIDNRPFDVQGGVQNDGDIFSVHIQKEGDASRTTLFTDYLADRDAVTIDPVFGAPATNLTHLFFSAIGANQGTNNVLFDDFYISNGAINSTVPVAASTFVRIDPPVEIKVSGVSFDQAGKSVSFSWTSTAGAKYSVLKASAITGPWTTVVATVTATGASSTYNDTSITGTGFYRIQLAP